MSSSAGCATCTAWSAILIGVIGGCVLRAASLLVLEILLVDDPLDAFAVHGACGAWGVLAAALFSTDYYTLAVIGVARQGLVYGGTSLLSTALVFIISVVAWSGSISMIIFLSLRRLGILRVVERRGDAKESMAFSEGFSGVGGGVGGSRPSSNGTSGFGGGSVELQMISGVAEDRHANFGSPLSAANAAVALRAPSASPLYAPSASPAGAGPAAGLRQVLYD